MAFAEKSLQFIVAEVAHHHEQLASTGAITVEPRAVTFHPTRKRKRRKRFDLPAALNDTSLTDARFASRDQNSMKGRLRDLP